MAQKNRKNTACSQEQSLKTTVTNPLVHNNDLSLVVSGKGSFIGGTFTTLHLTSSSSKSEGK